MKKFLQESPQLRLGQAALEMKRRGFLKTVALPFSVILSRITLKGSSILQDAPTNTSKIEHYFPDPVHKFVWRNWDLVPVEKMAKVLKVDPSVVKKIGLSMDLPKLKESLQKYARRNRFAIVMRNWDYVPNNQLSLLLDMTEDELKNFLLEDIAYFAIVGPKPECEPLVFSSLRKGSPKVSFIKQTLERNLGKALNEPGEERFAFIEELSRVHSGSKRIKGIHPNKDEYDLSGGWSLVLPERHGVVLETAAHDFARFISESMGGSIQVLAEGTSKLPTRNTLRIQVSDRELGRTGSYKISSVEDAVRIVGGDETGAMQALFFLEELMELRGGPFLPASMNLKRETALFPRILFPYFALYGDILKENDIAPYYPYGYLARMGHMGINGLWLHGVLRDLAPSSFFPEFGKESRTRLEKLNWLVHHAEKYGIGVYLYLNEPRGMPENFFERYPEIKGEPGRPDEGLYSLCSSTEHVQNFLLESTRHLFERVPKLAGIILITASENPTNCYSLRRTTSCPRCRLRPPYEVVAEVIKWMARGAKQAKPSAEVIAWDWSWGIIEDDPQERIIKSLPPEVTLMVDFERGTHIKRGGIDSVVDEYSLSVVGPSPRAQAHLRLAKEKELKRMAKVQLGSTWECGSVPFIPVLYLLGRKFQAMLSSGVEGAMESWTLGSYPSINTELAKNFYWVPHSDLEEALMRIASMHYGKRAAPTIVKAWKTFSQAFEAFPFSNSVVYSSPVQYGPAHPLYFFETGKSPRLLNSRDSLSWTRPFGPEIVARQFEQMATQWDEGIKLWRSALRWVHPEKLPQAEKDLGVARVIYLHFESVANQIQFLLHRQKLKEAKHVSEARQALANMRPIVAEELALARELYRICKSDSRIGFEASVQYFYRPQDLLEKIVCCQDILDHLIPAMEKQHKR